ncbi:MAG: alpha/beta hydrolase family protein [Bryobacteraceae bacterium]
MRPLILLGALTLGCSAQPLTREQESDLRSKIRAALFVPDRLPALAAKVHGTFRPAPGVVAERVTYGTLLGLRVPAILYRPEKRKAKLPALIVVNGHGGDKYAWYAYWSGVAYARGGAAVLTYDPIGEGERNMERKSGTRAHDALESPEEMGRRMGGLMMTEVMQAVSYLRSRPEVDGRRIAAMGYSMGSFVLSLACAVETRLDACVLVGGGNLDGPGGTWERGKPMCQGIPYKSLAFLGDRPAVIYALHASRGPTLTYNGLQDQTVSITKQGPDFFADMHRRAARVHGSERGLFEYQFTNGAHRPYFVTRPVALWLERKLDFPNWTEADIEAMPVTHISEWANRTGVTLDRLYASEEREGGTLAIGAALPVPSRQDLSVFTPAQWEREKDRLIYEAWVKRARGELGR